MMKTMILFFMTLTLSFSALADRRGNGGDSIYCLVNGERKAYSLDFITTNSNPTNLDAYTGTSEWIKRIAQGQESGNSLDFIKAKEIIKLIGTRLRNNGMATLTFKAQRFHRELLSNDLTNYSKFRWVPGASPLLEVQDENLVRALPLGCAREDINQAVVRDEGRHRIVFYYDAQDLIELNQNSPIQLSYLLLHEWAREFLENPRDIAQLVNYLHSEQFFNASYEGIRTALILLLDNAPRETSTQCEGRSEQSSRRYSINFYMQQILTVAGFSGNMFCPQEAQEDYSYAYETVNNNRINRGEMYGMSILTNKSFKIAVSRDCPAFFVFRTATRNSNNSSLDTELYSCQMIRPRETYSHEIQVRVNRL